MLNYMPMDIIFMTLQIPILHHQAPSNFRKESLDSFPGSLSYSRSVRTGRREPWERGRGKALEARWLLAQATTSTWNYPPTPPLSNIRELKQQRRRRLQKRHLKSEFSPLQTLSHLFHLVYFVKCWQMFLQLNSEGLYQSSGQEKKVVVLCSRTRQNVNSGIFTL